MEMPILPPRKLGNERESTFDVGGIQLRVREWGRAEAPAIVLLHGLRGFSGTWRRLADALSSDYRLIAIDQRGRGESDWDPARNYYTDAYLADLSSIVDQLALHQFVLVGHSMGGTTAYVYADRNPHRLRGLIIEDIAPGASVAGEGAERVKAEMAALPMDFADWHEARDYWKRIRPNASDEALEQRLAETLKTLPDGRIGWRYDAAGISQTRRNPDPERVVDLWPVARRLSVPTLIIRGEKSDFCPLVSVDAMIKDNEQIRSVTVEGASHYVHDDAPNIFYTHVRQFLDETFPATAQPHQVPGRHRHTAGNQDNGAVSLFRAAYDSGARICFANPGTTELTLVNALEQIRGIRPVLGLFEGVCTGAADGYSRVSRQVALTLLHLGPGFANGIANLHNARRAHSRIVNIIGDHATWHLPYDAPLTSDIDAMAGAVSAKVTYLGDPETLVDDVQAAFASACSLAGSISTVIVPTDIVEAPACAVSKGSPVQPRPLRDVPNDHVRAVAQAMSTTNQPILLLGGNALSERGLRSAARIRDGIGARLIMESYPAIVELGGDLPRLERQEYFPQDVQKQFGDAQVILAGVRKPVSYFGYEGQPSSLVDPSRLISLCGDSDDAASAVEALASILQPVQSRNTAALASPPSRSEELTPAEIVEELVVQLPQDAIISLEGSTLGGPYLRQAYRARRHRVMTNTGGAIGQGLPCAVGAALAAPEARVIALQSDGSAQYTLQALWTMAHENLRVTVIIAANHRYGILQTELKRAEVSLETPVVAMLTRLDNPHIDWTALASGYGVPSVRVKTSSEFSAALSRGLFESGPFLIEADLL